MHHRVIENKKDIVDEIAYRRRTNAPSLAQTIIVIKTTRRYIRMHDQPPVHAEGILTTLCWIVLFCVFLIEGHVIIDLAETIASRAVDEFDATVAFLICNGIAFVGIVYFTKDGPYSTDYWNRLSVSVFLSLVHAGHARFDHTAPSSLPGRSERSISRDSRVCEKVSYRNTRSWPSKCCCIRKSTAAEGRSNPMRKFWCQDGCVGASPSE